MTILHEIHTFGKIRFNQTLRVLPISEKMLSQQLKELIHDGLIRREVDGSTYPPTIDYLLTDAGSAIIPAIDELYIWGIINMKKNNIPIDEDALVMHNEKKYMDALNDVLCEREKRMIKMYPWKRSNKK